MSIKLTKEQICEAQESWGNGIVRIGEIWSQKGNYKNETRSFLKKHYGFNDGIVLFKPTLACREQFRDSFAKALSYFIGNSVCPEDHGFATRPWVKVSFENAGVIINQNNALAMGNYFFEGTDGNIIKVEYTFAYYIAGNNSVKINLHHSSLPYPG